MEFTSNFWHAFKRKFNSIALAIFMFKSVLGFSGIFFSISNSNRFLNPDRNYEMTLPNTASSYDFSMVVYKKTKTKHVWEWILTCHRDKVLNTVDQIYFITLWYATSKAYTLSYIFFSALPIPCLLYHF